VRADGRARGGRACGGQVMPAKAEDRAGPAVLALDRRQRRQTPSGRRTAPSRAPRPGLEKRDRKSGISRWIHTRRERSPVRSEPPCLRRDARRPRSSRSRAAGRGDRPGSPRRRDQAERHVQRERIRDPVRQEQARERAGDVPSVVNHPHQTRGARCPRPRPVTSDPRQLSVTGGGSPAVARVWRPRRSAAAGSVWGSRSRRGPAGWGGLRA
jgi:hypothetical protein